VSAQHSGAEGVNPGKLPNASKTKHLNAFNSKLNLGQSQAFIVINTRAFLEIVPKKTGAGFQEKTGYRIISVFSVSAHLC